VKTETDSIDEKVMKLPYFYRGQLQNAQDSVKRQN